MTDQPRGLTPQQVDVLLQPIMGNRVKQQDGQSYLPQQDVRAHLNRIFGFGGWSTHVLELALVHEAPTLRVDKRTQKRNPERVDVLWRATVRLTIRDQHGNQLAEYEDAATGDAQNSEPLAAHDLALKSAVSTAIKRAATCLGDQFGLSLYNKGSQDAFVRMTLVGATAQPHDLGDAPAATEEQDPDARPQPDEADIVNRDSDREQRELVRAEDGAPQPDVNPESERHDPEARAERAVTQRHQRRQEVNSKRTGPDQAQAKARVWDAVSETHAGAARMAELDAECGRRGWNLIAQLHTDRLLELAAYYEEKADDDIRARIARGE